MARCVNKYDLNAREKEEHWKGYRHYMRKLTRCMCGRQQDLLGIFWVTA